jgi:glycosyltransferase involved in cell wall biosynthesis
MKILFIIPEEYQGQRWGGVTSYVLTQAKTLKEYGHTVIVLTPGKQNEMKEQYGICFYKIKHENHKNSTHRFFNGLLKNICPTILERIHWAIDVAHFITTIKPLDVIESPEWGSSTLLLRHIPHIKVIIRLHKSWYMYQKDNELPIHFSDRITDLFERWCIITASAVTSPTKYMLDQYPCIQRILRKRNIPIKIIPYGVEIPRNKITKRVVFAPYILTVGRIEIGKGSFLLTNAFIQLSKTYPKLRLVFVGEDTDLFIDDKNIGCIAYLRKQLSIHGLLNRVLFIPRQNQSNLLQYYQHCLFYVAPSIGHENLSLALLEAIACGKAAVGSLSGGTPEAIKNGKNGMLFVENNSEDLRKKLRYMVDNIPLRKKFEKSALRARNVFDIDKVIKESLKFYLENLGHPK